MNFPRQRKQTKEVFRPSNQISRRAPRPSFKKFCMGVFGAPKGSTPARKTARRHAEKARPKIWRRHVCQIARQKDCQKICPIRMPERLSGDMPGRMSARVPDKSQKICQKNRRKISQTECPHACQIERQKVCQKERRMISQIECRG